MGVFDKHVQLVHLSVSDLSARMIDETDLEGRPCLLVQQHGTIRLVVDSSGQGSSPLRNGGFEAFRSDRMRNNSDVHGPEICAVTEIERGISCTTSRKIDSLEAFWQIKEIAAYTLGFHVTHQMRHGMGILIFRLASGAGQRHRSYQAKAAESAHAEFFACTA